LDQYDEEVTANAILDASDHHREDIGLGHATFTWSKESTDGTLTPSRRVFSLRIEDEVIFKKGVVNMIIGARNKTALLHHLR
jgi:hypothetical protein